MSVIQRSARILKSFLRSHSNNLLKYGNLHDFFNITKATYSIILSFTENLLHGFIGILGRSSNHDYDKIAATVAEKMLDDLDDRLVWIDMEMTGLDVDTCHILEVACLITDAKLKVVSDDFNVIINQPDHLLDNMNEWCVKQHAKSGLTDSCRTSKISLETAEQELLQFVKRYVHEGKCPVAGNSVYMDRLFLRKYMPSVDSYLHYRIVDTSTIKELTRRWNLEAYKGAPKKSFSHRAIEDIRESIEELKYYRKNVFKSSECQL